VAGWAEPNGTCSIQVAFWCGILVAVSAKLRSTIPFDEQEFGVEAVPQPRRVCAPGNRIDWIGQRLDVVVKEYVSPAALARSGTMRSEAHSSISLLEH